ncbi:MAG TPA: carboxypeptidase-like regulatory domain-containing protein, partial [Bryobacteraceae bacterium]|nr:carboxypeptidase-like regulatory domain-containing protein [Bryobacteraceae bacterium]
MSRRVLLAGWCIAGLALQTAWAQTQSINGTIRGRVSDPAGSGVPGAQIAVHNDSTGFERSQTTNDEGYYVLPNLPLGSYTVNIQKQGFETQRRPGVTLNAGSEVTIDAQLVVGQVSTTIEVGGGA